MLKSVEWVGSSKADLKRFPDPVQHRMGFAIYRAQLGRRHRDAKPLKGFGAGVLEVVSRHDGDTFRAVYTVRFETAVYVLHAFQKKARRGIATPRRELDLVRRRLQAAERHYRDTHSGD
ncbi:MAG: addiction module toxin RelE [Rhodospirillaceae bacterium]|nr:addiction module toxin RelE [Rhodospirillaceae bacterium]MYB12948.1 addiction module toxin RelE [Rhodospirillaceae bacterium]MYI48960.1 addiction module toxin RelE [Rhodospirillaceae bacterium]